MWSLGGQGMRRFLFGLCVLHAVATAGLWIASLRYSFGFVIAPNQLVRGISLWIHNEELYFRWWLVGWTLPPGRSHAVWVNRLDSEGEPQEGFIWEYTRTGNFRVTVPLSSSVALFGAWPAFTLCLWLKRRVARRSV